MYYCEDLQPANKLQFFKWNLKLSKVIGNLNPGLLSDRSESRTQNH